MYTARVNDKRTQLIEAAIDLFAKEGFWNTPTSRIAKHAGVATGTLFNYFESKDALIDAVYMQLKQEWATHIMQGLPESEGAKACLEHFWFRFIEWGLRFPERYTLKMQLGLSNLVSAEAQKRQGEEMALGYTLIEQGIADGVLIDIPADYFGAILLAQLEAAVQYAMQHELSDMSLTKHITAGFEAFWSGVAK